ncbi:transcription factor WER-like [Diospyros lotus]|uniref:transcription factor WER-like n=1 Tax=Diospyros lotus TaxID=55363 RepID=UPI002256E57C|nr:transcription factor WER-like [Diospyros lotus]
MSSSEGDATSNNLRGDRGSAYGDGDNDVVKEDWKKGSWSKSEDEILLEYVKRFGAKNWNEVWKNTSLKRCGQSCRLRWANYLNPDLKKGAFSVDEVNLITELHKKHGNRWSHIASQVLWP